MFYKWKAAGLLAIALILGGIWSNSAKAVVVDYTVTFTGTDGTKENGSGVLAINERILLSSFS